MEVNLEIREREREEKEKGGGGGQKCVGDIRKTNPQKRFES